MSVRTRPTPTPTPCVPWRDRHPWGSHHLAFTSPACMWLLCNLYLWFPGFITVILRSWMTYVKVRQHLELIQDYVSVKYLLDSTLERGWSLQKLKWGVGVCGYGSVIEHLLGKHETLGPTLTTAGGRKTVFIHQASRAKHKYLICLIHIFRSRDPTSAVFLFRIFLKKYFVYIWIPSNWKYGQGAFHYVSPVTKL